MAQSTNDEPVPQKAAPAHPLAPPPPPPVFDEESEEKEKPNELVPQRHSNEFGGLGMPAMAMPSTGLVPALPLAPGMQSAATTAAGAWVPPAAPPKNDLMVDSVTTPGARPLSNQGPAEAARSTPDLPSPSAFPNLIQAAPPQTPHAVADRVLSLPKLGMPEVATTFAPLAVINPLSPPSPTSPASVASGTGPAAAKLGPNELMGAAPSATPPPVNLDTTPIAQVAQIAAKAMGQGFPQQATAARLEGLPPQQLRQVTATLLEHAGTDGVIPAARLGNALKEARDVLIPLNGVAADSRSAMIFNGATEIATDAARVGNSAKSITASSVAPNDTMVASNGQVAPSKVGAAAPSSGALPVGLTNASSMPNQIGASISGTGLAANGGGASLASLSLDKRQAGERPQGVPAAADAPAGKAPDGYNQIDTYRSSNGVSGVLVSVKAHLGPKQEHLIADPVPGGLGASQGLAVSALSHAPRDSLRLATALALGDGGATQQAPAAASEAPRAAVGTIGSMPVAHGPSRSFSL